MERFVRVLVAVAVLILLEFGLIWLGASFVLNPLYFFVMFFCLNLSGSLMLQQELR